MLDCIAKYGTLSLIYDTDNFRTFEKYGLNLKDICKFSISIKAQNVTKRRSIK